MGPLARIGFMYYIDTKAVKDMNLYVQINKKLIERIHCVKIVLLRSFSGPYFSSFELNTHQKVSEYGDFTHSDYLINVNDELEMRVKQI